MRITIELIHAQVLWMVIDRFGPPERCFIQPEIVEPRPNRNIPEPINS